MQSSGSNSATIWQSYGNHMAVERHSNGIQLTVKFLPLPTVYHLNTLSALALHFTHELHKLRLPLHSCSQHPASLGTLSAPFIMCHCHDEKCHLSYKRKKPPSLLTLSPLSLSYLYHTSSESSSSSVTEWTLKNYIFNLV